MNIEDEGCAGVAYAFAAALALALAGCGGPVVLRESLPLAQGQPLIEARDSSIAVAVDAVVVRNGVGSWVRNASWDEYRFRIRSLTGRDLRLEKITLFDALDHPVEPGAERATLLEATREIGKRYAAGGLPVPSTQHGRGWPIPFVGSAPVSGALLLGAVVLQAVNESQIDGHLKDRHTPLPAVIGSKESTVVAFFPIVLRPAEIEVIYVEDGVERRVSMAPREALSRVRETRAAQILDRPEPRMPADQARKRVAGYARAQLLVDARGNVTQVDILESSSPALVGEARRTFARYKYTEGASARTVEEVMPFKRSAGAP